MMNTLINQIDRSTIDSSLRRVMAARLGLAMASLCALAGALVLSSAPALAAREFVPGGVFGSVGSGTGEFTRPMGIAVNEATSKVYVADSENNRVEWFSAAGAYQGQFDGSAPGAEVFNGPENVAVDNSAGPSGGDVYVAATGGTRNSGNVIDKFDAAGGFLGRVETSSSGAGVENNIAGLAVDASGNLWVYDVNGNIDECDELGACQTKLTTSADRQNRGLAVDRNGDIAVLNGPSRRLQEFNAKLEPVRLAETQAISGVALAFDPLTGDLFVDGGTEGALGGTEITEYGPVGQPLNAIRSLAGFSESSGVTFDRANETLYATEREEGKVKMFVPEPAAEPTVDDSGVTSVSATSATLVAQINPRGASTEYHFEYDTSEYTEGSSPHGVASPDVNIGEGFGDQQVSVPVNGLSPGTTYYFRVVAHNARDAHGPIVGPAGQSFTTQLAGGQLTLPDGRAWELVSPPDKLGAEIFSLSSSYVTQSSAAGGALTYVTSMPTEPDPGGNLEHVQVLARRGSEGWSSHDMSLPQATAAGLTQASEYSAFSTDLMEAYVEPVGSFVPLSELASERTPYVRGQASCDAAGEGTSSGCFVPLLTKENVPPETHFGGDPSLHTGAVRFAGAATPDVRHVILGTNEPVSLTRVAAPAGALYEWSAGMPATSELPLVSVLPPEEGGTPVTGVPGGNGETGLNARRAISSDGARVFWEDTDNHHLYMRDTRREATVRLDAPQPGAPSGGSEAAAHFQTASNDGSLVFFTGGALTAQSAVGDVFVCDIVEEERAPACALTDVTPIHLGENANVEGVIPGASNDGTYVYFVATGVQSGEANATGEHAVPGANNLYLAHYDAAGKRWEGPRFIARLSANDRSDWSSPQGGAFSGDLSKLTSGVSGDGRYLAFMSNRALTGYDSHDARSGAADEEVYLYDAQANRIVCASCDPTGARPTGHEVGVNEAGLVDAQVPPGTWVAANIPGWTPWGSLGQAIYQSRYLANDGRLFFNSASALVPQDANGNEDVYEFEPAGVGGCTASAVTFSKHTGGCVAIISSGSASGESAFLDASETGDDVFFMTAERLVPQDVDTALDVYDAHVCSPSSPCTTPPAVAPPCATADACRQAPLPQSGVFGAAGSATFAGAGNLVPSGSGVPVRVKPLTRAQLLARALRACHADRNRRKRRLCEARARKRYGPARSHGSRATKTTKRSRG
jgi:hypothetical protein